MADYANKAVKEIVVVLAGCIGYADTLKGLEFRNSKKARRSLAAMQNHAEKALEAIMEGLDTDQVQGMLRFANSCNLMAVPKHNPAAQKECYICPVDAFDRLVLEPTGECAFCMKEGREVKRCQRRSDLAACGIAGETSTECPYQG